MAVLGKMSIVFLSLLVGTNLIQMKESKEDEQFWSEIQSIGVPKSSDVGRIGVSVQSYDRMRPGIEPGGKIGGYRVSPHASTAASERNISLSPIQTSLTRAKRYYDTVNDSTVFVHNRITFIVSTLMQQCHHWSVLPR